MKKILMNKNTEVLVAEYDTITNGFSKIYEIKNIDYAPMILSNLYKKTNNNELLLKKLSEWFAGRGIPSFRDDLDILLARINKLKGIINDNL